MGYWWFLFMCNLLIPVIMIISGYIMLKHCPKKINYISGYRTKRSMKNIETWKFANHYAGLLWLKVGLLLIIPTILFQLLFIKTNTSLSLIIVFIQLVIMLITIIPIENSIKKIFNDDGTLR